MPGKKFSPQEDQFIIDYSQLMTYGQMAVYLGRPSVHSIYQRVVVLKRRGKLQRSGQVVDGVFHAVYSKEEDETIKILYPQFGKEALARWLGRPESSIAYRVEKLGVKKGVPLYLNIGKISKLLRVTRVIVMGLVSRGLLKASHNGRRSGPYREWKIERQDFYDFIRNRYDFYDPERVSDKFLRSIIKDTPAAAKAISTRQAAKVLGISEVKVKRRIGSGEIIAYKSFAGQTGPPGFRWCVLLDDSTFEWFRVLADNNNDRVVGWLVETARQRSSDSLIFLEVLLKYEQEIIKKARRTISVSPAADKILREFEKTTEGERLKSLIN